MGAGPKAALFQEIIKKYCLSKFSIETILNQELHKVTQFMNYKQEASKCMVFQVI